MAQFQQRGHPERRGEESGHLKCGSGVMEASGLSAELRMTRAEGFKFIQSRKRRWPASGAAIPDTNRRLESQACDLRFLASSCPGASIASARAVWGHPAEIGRCTFQPPSSPRQLPCRHVFSSRRGMLEAPRFRKRPPPSVVGCATAKEPARGVRLSRPLRGAFVR